MSNLIKKFKLPQNPYLLFSPFLILYVLLIIIFRGSGLVGDELRHLYYANNLLHGFYSPHSPHVNLGIGPGYPIVLAPFVAMHFPYLGLKLLNAVFYYLSVVFLFRAARQMVSFNKSFLVGLFWGCNYITFNFMYFILTESFTIFLITLMLFLLVRAYQSKEAKLSRKYVYLSGFIIGYIALTKIIFGYVILFLVVGSAVLWLLNRKAVNYRKGLIISCVALIILMPYLIYTYYLTGKFFYLGTLAGNNMYWMTSSAPNEYGTWFPDIPPKPDTNAALHDKHPAQDVNPVISLKRIFVPGAEDSLKLYHQEDFDEFRKYDGVELDDAYKRVSYQNIKAHPAKYLQNCFSNFGRMLFGYPNSYMIQKPGDLLRIPPNGIILVLSLLCLLPTLINWRKIDYPIRFLLFFAVLYLGGSVFGSADIRMFSIIAPIMLLWIAYIMQRAIKVKLRFFGEM